MPDPAGWPRLPRSVRVGFRPWSSTATARSAARGAGTTNGCTCTRRGGGRACRATGSHAGSAGGWLGDAAAGDTAANSARWLVHLDDGPPLAAEHVIVATGYNHTPVTPDWPGLAGFTGDLVLARDYRNGRPYAGRDVLVVGTGNTGTEIATDLAEHGATRVWLAVRTPPHIIRRDMLGWPAQGTGILVRRLPPRLVDRVAHGLAAVQEPDLSAYGMPRADPGLYSRVLVGRVPVQDVGIVDAIRTRRVEPVAAVEACSTGEACPWCTVPTSPRALSGCGSPASRTRSRGCCASCASTPSGSPPPSHADTVLARRAADPSTGNASISRVREHGPRSQARPNVGFAGWQARRCGGKGLRGRRMGGVCRGRCPPQGIASRAQWLVDAPLGPGHTGPRRAPPGPAGRLQPGRRTVSSVNLCSRSRSTSGIPIAVAGVSTPAASGSASPSCSRASAAWPSITAVPL